MTKIEKILIILGIIAIFYGSFSFEDRIKETHFDNKTPSEAKSGPYYEEIKESNIYYSK